MENNTPFNPHKRRDKDREKLPIDPVFNFDEFNIGAKDIQQDALRLIQQAKESKENIGYFKVKPANQWIDEAKARPIPKMLFSEFWFEGELCILFADTNMGKSILAVQIGNSISLGKPIAGFSMEAEAQTVLYFDFELSDKQFENRYSEGYQNHYLFSHDFFRVEINHDTDFVDNNSIEEYLIQSFERCIIETGAKVIIVDNITYLKNETEKAKDALPLMKQLKALKEKYRISILALAHTPKRDLSKQITRNDLQGSKMLINFCDSSFAIGESHQDVGLRYLKQIKVRNTESKFDADNVIVCQIVKPSNFVEFEYVKFGAEGDHLKQRSENDQDNITQQVIAMNGEGRSLREIGAELGISHTKVNRIIKKNQ